MRAVIDTDVVVSALLTPTARISRILFYLARGDFTFLYRQDSLDEILDVLQRPRVTRGMVDPASIVEFESLLDFRGEVIEPASEIRVCRDPDDDKFLEIAVDGEADVIVSGDSDLLSLSSFRGIPIIKPADFLDVIGK